jgi:CubicO group peptidase (beta-lactamase class C family)
MPAASSSERPAAGVPDVIHITTRTITIYDGAVKHRTQILLQSIGTSSPVGTEPSRFEILRDQRPFSDLRRRARIGAVSSIDEFRYPQRGLHHVEVSAPKSVPWPEASISLEPRIVGAGREMGLDDFCDLTATTSLVVIVDETLVHERYPDPARAEDRLLGFSATKSVLAQVTGLAVGRGSLPDIDAEVCDYVPELLGSGYDAVTVRQVLTMTSGLDWAEDYRDPDSRASQLIGRWRDGRGGVRDLLGRIPAGQPPGTRYAYCSPDSMVLDWVRERATGQRFTEALANLWTRVGAERPAIVGLDGPIQSGGVEMAAAAMAATARDWARIGALQVEGRWGGDQVLDAGWVDDSSRPERSFLMPGRLPSTITTHAGFGYHWWPLDERGTKVMADGSRGQFVYVDRSRRTVVVKTSAWRYEDPWWDRQCRDLCYVALPAIAEAAVTAF